MALTREILEILGNWDAKKREYEQKYNRMLEQRRQEQLEAIQRQAKVEVIGRILEQLPAELDGAIANRLMDLMGVRNPPPKPPKEESIWEEDY